MVAKATQTICWVRHDLGYGYVVHTGHDGPGQPRFRIVQGQPVTDTPLVFEYDLHDRGELVGQFRRLALAKQAAARR